MMKKPYIGVTFKCCNVYARIYLNRQGTAYEGTCPRCYKSRAVAKVTTSGGSDARFFRV